MLFIWLPSVFLGVVPIRPQPFRLSRPNWKPARSWPSPTASLTPDDRATPAAPQRRGDDVILRLVEAYAPLWLAVAAGRRGHGSGDGKRLADPRAVDDVHRGHLRVLSGHWHRFWSSGMQVTDGRIFVVLVTAGRRT